MATSKEKKAQDLKDLIANLEEAKSIVFSTYRGLKVADLTALRKDFFKSDVRYHISKKTLMKIAFKKLGKEIDFSALKDDVAMSFGMSDEVAPAKVLADFAKTHKEIKFLGGILEGKFISDAEVESLSKIPSREQLLASVVGSIKSPISGFVNVLAGSMRNFVSVLHNISEKKQKVA